MKKGEVVEGKVYRIDFPNKGHVWVDGEKDVVVKDVLEGQVVSVQITKKRKGKCEGRLVEVLQPSEKQLEQPYCEHFASCGGCTYQNMEYKHQLDLKERQVKDLITDVISAEQHCTSADECGVSPCPMKRNAVEDVWEGIHESPLQFEYRNKMEYSFGDAYKDGPLALGMHKRGSFYDITTVDGCRITEHDFGEILMATQNFFKNLEATFFHKIRHTGYLRHLLVRKAKRTGEILVDLVTTSQVDESILQQFGSEEAMLKSFANCILELQENNKLTGKMVGILHTRNDGVADIIRDEGTTILYGQDYFFEEILGLKFKISPFSFFQTNSLGAEKLYETARDFIGELGKDSVVYDLYSGTGTIAQMLSPVAKKVIGVEIVEEAVEAAKENAKLNQLDNCEFIAGDVLKVLDTIEEKPDFIVLDPPRDGIHPKALERIISYGVDKMIYISCKPTSLARDLVTLQGRGYEVKRMCCVDMFPGTVHVETVVKLSLKKDTPKIEVTMEPSEESNYTPEEKATYQKIKDYVKDKHGVNVHTSYIAQVKRMCGLDMGENYNKSKKENPEVKQCPQEKVEYIKDALRHYRLL